MPTLDFLQTARKEFAYYRSYGEKTWSPVQDGKSFNRFQYVWRVRTLRSSSRKSWRVQMFRLVVGAIK